MPDHNLLSIDLSVSVLVRESLNDKNLGSKSYQRERTIRAKGTTYMNSDTALKVLPCLIQDLEKCGETQSRINESYDSLIKFIIGEAKSSMENVTKKRSTTKYKEYWVTELANKWSLMHNVEHLYRMSCKKRENIETCNFKKNIFLHGRKQFDKLLVKKKRSYYDKLMSKIDVSINRDPKEFWHLIKSLGPNVKSEIPWEVNVKGETITNKSAVLKEWTSQFVNLYNNTDADFNHKFKDEEKARSELSKRKNVDANLNCKVSKKELMEAVKLAKNKKAVGIDKIANELLKHDEIVKMLYVLFNVCLENNCIPDDWRIAIVNPIPKEAGRIIDPLRYRGISLQSCIYKVFSNILNTRLNKFLEEHQLLNDAQNGFRKKRSCEHHIFTVTNIIRNNFDKKKCVFATFIDFKKAFDLSNRELIFCKLSQNGVTGLFLNLLKTFYQGTCNQIRLNGVLGEKFSSMQGLKQGDNLSPTCFNVLINGLIEKIQSISKGIKIDDGEIVNILAYTDDIVILTETAEDMHTLLMEVSKWCKDWHISINIDKTKLVHFRKMPQHRSSEDFHISGKRIEIVKKYKYLGTWLNSKLSPMDNVENLSKSGSRALGGIIGKTKGNIHMNLKSFSKVFSCMVMPILDYSVGAWYAGGYQHCMRKLDQIQYRAMRFHSGLPKGSPISGLEGDYC